MEFYNLGGGCAKSISPPQAAKDSLDGDIFFLILRSKIKKKMSPSKYNMARSAIKRLLTQPQDYFERHVIFVISRSEITKMTCLSKDNMARSATKGLFTQPQIIF